MFITLLWLRKPRFRVGHHESIYLLFYSLTEQAFADPLPGALGRCCPCPQSVDSFAKVVVKPWGQAVCRALATLPLQRKVEGRASAERWSSRCTWPGRRERPKGWTGKDKIVLKCEMDVKIQELDFIYNTFSFVPENSETEKHESSKDFIFIISYFLNWTPTIAHQTL